MGPIFEERTVPSDMVGRRGTRGPGPLAKILATCILVGKQPGAPGPGLSGEVPESPGSKKGCARRFASSTSGSAGPGRQKECPARHACRALLLAAPASQGAGLCLVRAPGGVLSPPLAACLRSVASRNITGPPSTLIVPDTRTPSVGSAQISLPRNT